MVNRSKKSRQRMKKVSKQRNEEIKRRSSETKIMDLPSVIMVEILSRLPIKPIFCCKCVCKSWYNLVSHDPLFLKLYHSTSPFPCLLLSAYNCFVSAILELEAEDFDYDSCPLKKSIRLYRDFHFPLRPEVLKLIGSCNGFICLLNGEPYKRKHSVYISNPLLGEYFKLKLPEWEETVSPHSYGFCFSQASGQYKVLRSIVRKFQGGSKVSELEVYTLGVDENWRNVGIAPYPHWFSFPNVNVNGAVHWINSGYSVCPESLRIYSFNVGSEKLQILPSPPGLKYDINEVILAELGNCLCLADNFSCKNHVDIWWMKEYGVADSWTRDRISKEFIPPEIRNDIFIPIITWKDGEILMQSPYHQQLLSYNPKENKFRQVIVYDYGNEATTYIPCFHSLKTIMGDNFQVSNAYLKTQIV